ncbi:hypothetical protein FRC16_010458 [Serendipita sp. 398]|nr:hypothetical protein FRC16_010458 [Serendipita sp. 398]
MTFDGGYESRFAMVHSLPRYSDLYLLRCIHSYFTVMELRNPIGNDRHHDRLLAPGLAKKRIGDELPRQTSSYYVCVSFPGRKETNNHKLAMSQTIQQRAPRQHDHIQYRDKYYYTNQPLKLDSVPANN